MEAKPACVLLKSIRVEIPSSYVRRLRRVESDCYNILMFRAIQIIPYVLLGIGVTLCTGALIIFLPEIPFALNIQKYVSSGAGKTILLVWQLGWATIAMNSLSANLYILTLSALVGLNAALAVAFFRKFKRIPNTANIVSGSVGMTTAILGIGCAACGTLGLLAITGALGGTILTVLPYEGYEIGMTGLILLAYSAFSFTRLISRPAVC